ncbi:MAG TPA: hypothetical protein VFH44_06170 [Solirubrobacterales bacterium]|nr:hypothetical protein [Solirubrobacterales bacterium]
MIDEDGLSPGELDALRGVLARDPALAAELELILPALDGAARRGFWRELAAEIELRSVDRPAAAVLAALVIAARG